MAAGFEEVEGGGDTGYHYMGCAKTFALMGKAFAEANLTMLKERP